MVEEEEDGADEEDGTLRLVDSEDGHEGYGEKEGDDGGEVADHWHPRLLGGEGRHDAHTAGLRMDTGGGGEGGEG